MTTADVALLCLATFVAGALLMAAHDAYRSSRQRAEALLDRLLDLDDWGRDVIGLNEAPTPLMERWIEATYLDESTDTYYIERVSLAELDAEPTARSAS